MDTKKLIDELLIGAGVTTDFASNPHLQPIIYNPKCTILDSSVNVLSIRGLCAVGNPLKSQGVQGGVKNILPQGHSGLSRVWQRAEAGMAGFHPKGGTRGCRIH